MTNSRCRRAFRVFCNGILQFAWAMFVCSAGGKSFRLSTLLLRLFLPMVGAGRHIMQLSLADSMFFDLLLAFPTVSIGGNYAPQWQHTLPLFTNFRENRHLLMMLA
jgi:hypothetical protein